jgi:hypothetical protein
VKIHTSGTCIPIKAKLIEFSSKNKSKFLCKGYIDANIYVCSDNWSFKQHLFYGYNKKWQRCYLLNKSTELLNLKDCPKKFKYPGALIFHSVRVSSSVMYHLIG